MLNNYIVGSLVLLYCRSGVESVDENRNRINSRRSGILELNENSRINVPLPKNLPQHIYFANKSISQIQADIWELKESYPPNPPIREYEVSSTTTSPSTTTTMSSSSLSVLDESIGSKILYQRSVWEIIWEAHIYFSGTLFVLLALYCGVNILRLHAFSRLFSRGYFVTLNLCLMLVGILRPILLFHDPYNSGDSLPRGVAYALLNTVFPCITTSFAVLFLALLRATQIELVSPAFQTPKALGIFCGIHILLSLSVDITIGFIFGLRYLVLLGQGFFIVWSLLLSAGYFYIFSAMNKMALRYHSGDYLRTMYPKLMMEGRRHTSLSIPLPSNHLPSSLSSSKKPPLSRAITTTLGVALLGSFMGGVQLFAMIKMFGLFKQDMNLSSQNDWAWNGYQVSMRFMEVLICSLLAVIATTPLLSDPETSESPSGASSWLCCRTQNPPREFEDEIYSEICSNNHSVRHIQLQSQIPPPHFDLGAIHGSTLALSSIPLTNSITSHRRRHHTGTISRTSGVYQDLPRGNNQSVSVASSRATLDTALYSNIKSRPSSMLFNDSGFVRFRMGNDPSRNQGEILRQSSSDLTAGKSSQPDSSELKDGGLRTSQSFDETVLFMDGSSPSNRQNSSPIYKSIPSESEEMLYEAPNELQLPSEPPSLFTGQDSDIESYYGRNNGHRAPSICSSVSATQSFDMRIYGPSALSKPTAKQLEEKKLENPFYYYGSTRNQKKGLGNHNNIITTNTNEGGGVSGLKPRPLLPSQRLELQASGRASRPFLRLTQPETITSTITTSPTAITSNTITSTSSSFQRSRSLGNHYGTVDRISSRRTPIRNTDSFSMTPVSYAKYHHHLRYEATGYMTQGSETLFPSPSSILSPILTDQESSPPLPNNTRRRKENKEMSPLEYSALLKYISTDSKKKNLSGYISVSRNEGSGLKFPNNKLFSSSDSESDDFSIQKKNSDKYNFTVIPSSADSSLSSIKVNDTDRTT